MKRQETLKEARSFTVPQLSGKIVEGKKRLIELDQERLLGKLKNTNEIRSLRRQIAQWLTVRDEKVTEQLRKENA